MAASSPAMLLGPKLDPRNAGWFRQVKALFDAIADRISSGLARHGRKLWYLHSVYALTLGAMVVAFAQKGFERARVLAVSVVLSWLLVVTFFSLHGSGAQQQDIEAAGTKARLRFFVMTYFLKNLYQGMLFFLLPFYWKSATRGASNFYFVLVICVCAFLSTMDVVFDRVVMRRRGFASILHGFTIFACLNLVIPAIFPNTRTLYSLVSAAGITIVAFWTLNVPLRAFRKPLIIVAMLSSMALGMFAAYSSRFFIPPVPMYLANGAVGPEVLTDGRLAMEVKTLHESVIAKLQAVTDVVIPGGEGDRLHHVWRLNGRGVYRATEDTARVEGPQGTVRLRSTLKGEQLPDDLIGDWTIDVETEDGQLVGRVSFTVIR